MAALAQRSARRLAISLRIPAWDMHAQAILETMRSEMQNRDVACVQFKESAGGLVLGLGRDARWQPSEVRQCALDPGVWDEVEIEVRGSMIGTIRVGVTPRFQEEILRDRFQDSLVRMALLEVVIVLSLLLYLRRVFIAPLFSLARTAERIAQIGRAHV